MTTESAPWQGHIDHQRPQQTKTLENAPNPDDSKGVLRIRNIFANMLKKATGPNGLPLITTPMNKVDPENQIFKAGRYMPGYAKMARFVDGIWVVAMSSDTEDMIYSRHELKIYHHPLDEDDAEDEPDTYEPDTYQITPLNIVLDDNHTDKYMEGVDQIAARVDEFEFGQVVGAYNQHAANRWPGKVSVEEVMRARIAVSGIVVPPHSIIYPR
jgi:hypothetical protein